MKVKTFLEQSINTVTNSCILWPFATTDRGYPVMNVNGKMIRVCRYICEEFHGPPSQAGLHAAHSCGNKLCINGKHLSWKTPLENAQDKILHGTVAKKLTEQAVMNIRLLSKDGFTKKELAIMHNISPRTIDNVVNYDTWKHVK